MLLGMHSPFGPVAVATLTSGGLGLLLLSTVLLIALVLPVFNRYNRAGQFSEESANASPTALRHRDQLTAAMEDLHNTALELIERRREIHHLNVHQWHYAHRDETSQEIAATKRYRQAKSALELHRLSLPTQFWMPVDNFCGAIELSLSREIYSPPNDKQVYETFNRLWHSTMRQINDLVAGTPTLEEAHQSAD